MLSPGPSAVGTVEVPSNDAVMGVADCDFLVAGQDSLCEGDISINTFCLVPSQEPADQGASHIITV